MWQLPARNVVYDPRIVDPFAGLNRDPKCTLRGHLNLSCLVEHHPRHHLLVERTHGGTDVTRRDNVGMPCDGGGDDVEVRWCL